MTLTELLPMLQRLGFDTTQTPARAGEVTLAELEYDEIDAYWHFRFRWADIELHTPPSGLPDEIWQCIESDASPDNDDVMIFRRSRSSVWTADSDYIEIESSLAEELDNFAAKMRQIETLVAPWRT